MVFVPPLSMGSSGGTTIIATMTVVRKISWCSRPHAVETPARSAPNIDARAIPISVQQISES